MNSELPFSLSESLQMQRSIDGCLAFSLNYLLESIRIADFHEQCAFLTENSSDRAALKRFKKGDSVKPVSWHDLPFGFGLGAEYEPFLKKYRSPPVLDAQFTSISTLMMEKFQSILKHQYSPHQGPFVRMDWILGISSP